MEFIESDWLTVQSAIAYSGLSRQTIYDRRKDGSLLTKREGFGARPYIDRASLDQCIKKHSEWLKRFKSISHQST